MIPINDDRFFEIIENTILDFEAVGDKSDGLDELRNILKNRAVSLMNVSFLIEVILAKSDFEESVNKVICGARVNRETAVNIVSTVRDEHEYVKNVLMKYFDWTESDGVPLIVSLKIPQ